MGKRKKETKIKTSKRSAGGKKIAVLGAGAFGAAFTKILAKKGHQLHLWAYQKEEVEHLKKTGEAMFLPGVPLGPKILFTDDLEEAVSGTEIVIGITPLTAIRRIFTQILPYLGPDVLVVNCSKGMETETCATVHQIYEEILPPSLSARAVYLSGPTFATELAHGLPAAIVAASHFSLSARFIQNEFSSNFFRVFTSEDVVGVCLAGALKNIYAIATGISDSLGYGNNARAAIIARALAEMSHLGTTMGANPMTFLGLAGIGDLVLTCIGDLSRNRRTGLALGRGKKLEQVLKELGGVAEGVYTAKAVDRLMEEKRIRMPIAHLIYRVLYEDLEPRQAVRILMSLPPTGEF